MEKLRDDNFLRQTNIDFADREVTGLNGDKPKASLVQLLGCSINSFGKLLTSKLSDDTKL